MSWERRFQTGNVKNELHYTITVEEFAGDNENMLLKNGLRDTHNYSRSLLLILKIQTINYRHQYSTVVGNDKQPYMYLQFLLNEALNNKL